MTFGAIWMYNAFPPYDKISDLQMCEKVTPTSMCIKVPGVLLVGLINGSIEMFKFSEKGMEPAYPLRNQI